MAKKKTKESDFNYLEVIDKFAEEINGYDYFKQGLINYITSNDLEVKSEKELIKIIEDFKKI